MNFISLGFDYNGFVYDKKEQSKLDERNWMLVGFKDQEHSERIKIWHQS